MKLLVTAWVVVDVGWRLAPWWPMWAHLVLTGTTFALGLYIAEQGRARIAERATVSDGR